MVTNIDSLNINNTHAPSETTSVKKTASGLPYIAMVDENSQETGNQDKIQTDIEKKRNAIYEKIRNICEEYRINLQEAKDNQLLERIAGCSKEELVKKNDNELNTIVKALKGALGITGDWEWFWNDRDVNDINKIAKDGNQRYVLEKTGGSKINQFWFNLKTKGTLAKQLESKGYLSKDCTNQEELKEGIKSYFKNEYLGNIETLENNEKLEKYKDALKAFGNFVNKYNTPEEKSIITSVIVELQASSRKLAAEVAIASCGIDKKAKATVAKGIESERINIATQKDALGKTLTKEDAVATADLTFKHMSKEDATEALENMKEQEVTLQEELAELLEKERKGTITKDELTRLEELKQIEDLYVIAGYTGASTGSARNENYSKNDKTEILNTINKDIAELELEEEVYTEIAEYVKKHPEFSDKAKSEFIELLDKTSEGKFSETIAEKLSLEKQTPEYKASQENNKEDLGFAIKTKVDSLPDTTTKIEDFYSTNIINPSTTIANNEHTRNIVSTDKKEPKNIEEASQQSIKALKTFAKETNVSSLALPLIILNLTQVAESVKSWAFERFASWNDSEKVLACNSMENNENKIEAGQYINSINALKEVHSGCKNSIVEKHYEKLIEKQEKLEA